MADQDDDTSGFSKLQHYAEDLNKRLARQVLATAFNPRAPVDYGPTLGSMQKVMTGELTSSAIQLGAYISAVATLRYINGPQEDKIFDYTLSTTEVEALSIPLDQRILLAKYDMDMFRYLMCSFAMGHPVMKASSQFLIDNAMAGRKQVIWHKLKPKAWNRDDVKKALFSMASMANLYLNVCEFVPIAIDPTALDYSRDPSSYWMKNYNWHSGTINKLGARVVLPTEIKSIQPWRHIYGGPVHLDVKLNTATSTEVVVCYIRGTAEVLFDGLPRSKFMHVMMEAMKGVNMTSSVNQSYVMASSTHLVRDPKALTAPGGLRPVIMDGEKSDGGMEGQFNIFGPMAGAQNQQTEIMFPSVDAAKHKDDEYLQAMQQDTDLMYASSCKAAEEKFKLINEHGTLEQRVMSRSILEQANTVVYPPPERSSTLATYKREIIATPPSNYSIDGYIQRINGEIAMLWGLNLTFLQGDSRVYQGVGDKNTKNVMAKITSTRKEVTEFFSFLYDCIWKQYDEDHLSYLKTLLLTTAMDPEEVSSQISDEEQRKLSFEGAKAVSRMIVSLDEMRHDRAFSIKYDLPVYPSVTEVLNTGVAAVTAGIKRPEEVEAEVDEIIDAQTDYLE